MVGGRHGVVVLLCAVFALVCAAGALAFGELPSGGQVNNDPAAGIDPSLSVANEDPTNADVVGGALTAGKPAVPWAIFQQQEKLLGGEDQIFVRSFAGGAWTTRGNGTVGGRSSASPTHPGSLNFDQGEEGEAPAIDFAGTGRTVPWATWYEETEGAEFETDVFASRFDNTGDANQGKWIFAGQGRGLGGGSVPVPALNIHTFEEAENPSVAGGSAVDPTKPGPWITWQEFEALPGGTDQIFAVRPIGPGAENCDKVKPEGVSEGGHIPAIGGFCWQQTGVPRVGPGGADPSLNVDPTREGVEPDIAFTGTNDGVPWIVWYEEGPSELEGPLAEELHENELVFAAKGVKDGIEANGEFHWVAVGSHESGELGTSGANNHLGPCAESFEVEGKCSLNSDPEEDAEDPRVAGGTMNPANPTVPWVAWDEETGPGIHQIFVSRLVGGKNFELANGGTPISSAGQNATRPDITFSGNIPYVSWRQEVEPGVAKGFYGHFVNAANPTFVLDESNVPLTPTKQADVREPISSGCIATPFNADGASCQGGALGTPFFLFTNGTSPRGLFAGAYQPETPVTGTSSSVGASTATISGAVNPAGAATNVFFEFGTTTAYGQATAPQRIEVSNSSVPFAASLSGLPAGTTIHYRAVASSDFASLRGADQTLTTSAVPISPPPLSKATKASVTHVTVSGTSAAARVSCTGAPGGKCALTLRLTITELLRHNRLVGLTARSKLKRKVVTVGSATVVLKVGETRVLHVGLNSAGKRLLTKRHVLKVRLRLSGIPAGQSTSGLPSTLTFHSPRHKHHH